MDSLFSSTKNMPYVHCPSCGHCRSWRLRRESRRCKRCRKEWVPRRRPVPGSNATEAEWRAFLTCALRYRTADAVRAHNGWARTRVLAGLARMRAAMAADVPARLSGTVEVDETYVGPQWRNRPWSVRKGGTKKGRGTQKQAVFGVYERRRGIVRCFCVPDVRKGTLLPIISATVRRGSLIYSDAYQLYRLTVGLGYRHDFVDHARNEFGRGDVNSNGMEGFWGVLKRRLKTTGGIRRERLADYLAEEVWRYNHRKLPENEKVDRLYGRLSGNFGG